MIIKCSTILSYLNILYFINFGVKTYFCSSSNQKLLKRFNPGYILQFNLPTEDFFPENNQSHGFSFDPNGPSRDKFTLDIHVHYANYDTNPISLDQDKDFRITTYYKVTLNNSKSYSACLTKKQFIEVFGKKYGTVKSPKEVIENFLKLNYPLSEYNSCLFTSKSHETSFIFKDSTHIHKIEFISFLNVNPNLHEDKRIFYFTLKVENLTSENEDEAPEFSIENFSDGTKILFHGEGEQELIKQIYGLSENIKSQKETGQGKNEENFSGVKFGLGLGFVLLAISIWAGIIISRIRIKKKKRKIYLNKQNCE